MYSVHADQLSSDVLQSVVDLLWSQLESMNSLVVNTASGQISSDPVAPSSDEPASKTQDEAEMQRK